MTQKKMNKRGFELAINTVIVMILALVLLIFLILFFTMGSGNFMEVVKGFFSYSNVDTIINSCNVYANSNFEYKYCCEKQNVKYYENDKKVQGNFTCFEISSKSFVSSEIKLMECSGNC